MSAYDQSLLRLRAEQRAEFWESVAHRWMAAFDHVVGCLDGDDETTAEVIADAMRLREAIPLKMTPTSGLTT